MQIHSLPASGAFGVGEIEVSPVMAVHANTALSGIMQDEMTSTKFSRDSRFHV